MEGSQSYPSGANFKDELHRAIETKDTPRARSILERRDVQDFIRRPRFFWHEVQNEIPVHNSNFCPEILKLLLEYGADPNSVCEYDGPGPLKVREIEYHQKLH